MAQFLPILYEQYQTEPYGPWYTREAYPWEYDARVQECIQIMNNPTSWNDPSESDRWFQQHIQIWQKRASHIRQEWAKQQVTQQVTQQAATQSANQLATQQVTQQVTQLATQQKSKRNEKTRQQYKRRTLHKAKRETITEKESVNNSNIQAISTKNLGTLSRIPRQIASQDSYDLEYTTVTWPDIFGTWHITQLSTQEKDLLRRSQPNHHGHLQVKD